jgi:hypothetical protein
MTNPKKVDPEIFACCVVIGLVSVAVSSLVISISYNAQQDRIQYQETLKSVMSCRMKNSPSKDINTLCGKIPIYSDFL